MSKNADADRFVDPNQDGMVQPPPPSYTTNNPNTSSYQPPAGQPPTAFYQAQPVSGQQSYAPPEGAYMPPSSGGYTGSTPPPPGVNPHTVIYVVDGNDPNGQQQVSPRGIPVALICFIFGLCTWLGYLFGMCFLNSKDPRERYWARCCAIMCFITSLIIIFGSIFGRH